jgi:hypothetical protein
VDDAGLRRLLQVIDAEAYIPSTHRSQIVDHPFLSGNPTRISMSWVGFPLNYHDQALVFVAADLHRYGAQSARELYR